MYTLIPDMTWSPPAISWLVFLGYTPCAYANSLAVSDQPTDLWELLSMPMLASSLSSN